AGAQLRIHGPAGWSAVGVVSGSVPAAPDERELLAVPVPAGTYTGISLGDDVTQVDIHVIAGQVEPVLIGVEGGRLIAGAAYAQSIGAGWTFATGSADALTAFWKPFGVELATGDSHVSTLALVDRHGYVRLVYRGVPAVGHDLPPQLVTSLGAAGLQELASGGDGWGSAEVLKALLTITGPIAPATQPGGRAPAFSLTGTDGTRVSLGALAGKPLVINFWATYCPPCKAEMPMLQRVMA